MSALSFYIKEFELDVKSNNSELDSSFPQEFPLDFPYDKVYFYNSKISSKYSEKFFSNLGEKLFQTFYIFEIADVNNFRETFKEFNILLDFDCRDGLIYRSSSSSSLGFLEIDFVLKTIEFKFFDRFETKFIKFNDQIYLDECFYTAYLRYLDVKKEFLTSQFSRNIPMKVFSFEKCFFAFERTELVHPFVKINPYYDEYSLNSFFYIYDKKELEKSFSDEMVYFGDFSINDKGFISSKKYDCIVLFSADNTSIKDKKYVFCKMSEDGKFAVELDEYLKYMVFNNSQPNLFNNKNFENNTLQDFSKSLNGNFNTLKDNTFVYILNDDRKYRIISSTFLLNSENNYIVYYYLIDEFGKICYVPSLYIRMIES